MGKREFSDTEVLSARIFCVIVGTLMLVGGAFAPRDKCVGAAGWVLELFT